MILGMEAISAEARSVRTSADRSDEYVCWSRMQAEAGQALEDIVRRKELERQSGGGIFLWGVGNAPAVMASALSKAAVPVRAIFSIMKSKPKIVDVAPERTVAWRRFLDMNGVERPLPPHALVTSRGDSAGGAKKFHYALMCRSETPLAIRRGVAFDPTAFRNAGGNQAPVGYSQVTALLKRVDGDDRDADGYEANLTAWLADSYWVRLTDPVELDGDRQELLGRVCDLPISQWRETVAHIRSGLSRERRPEGSANLLI